MTHVKLHPFNCQNIFRKRGLCKGEERKKEETMANKIPEKRRLSIEHIKSVEADPKKVKRYMKDNSEKFLNSMKKWLERDDLPQDMYEELVQLAPGEVVIILFSYLLKKKGICCTFRNH